MHAIDIDMVRAFADRFFGYGTWHAPYWFVGMEEGGVKTLEEFATRLAVRSALGKPDLTDLRSFHQQIGVPEPFTEQPRFQSTWRPLIRAVFSATERAPDDASLRRYQALYLGSATGETAVIEVLPLPSRSTKTWIYGSLQIREFSSRAAYEKAFRTPRTRDVLDRIEKFKPQAVVFYGTVKHWKTMFNLKRYTDRVLIGNLGVTRVLATTHPTYKGTTNEQWDEIGRLIRDYALSG